MFCFLGADAQLDQDGIGSYFSKFRPAKKWSVGLQLSPTMLNGDASDVKIGLSGGAHVKYSVSQSFGLKMSGNIGVLQGGRGEPSFGTNNGNAIVGQASNIAVVESPTSDSYEFTNNFTDLDVTAVYTLGNISFLRPLRKIQLTTFFGVGAIWSDATGGFTDAADAKGYASAWGQTGTEGAGYFTGVDANDNPTIVNADVVDATSFYKSRNLTIPFGFGIKRNFGSWLDLGLEWKTRWVRSDGIDAFTVPLVQNASKDFYSTLGLQASIKLGAKGETEHYDWLNPMETIYADMDSLKSITKELQKLASDEDGDGVADFFDKDNTTGADVNTYGNGKAVDTDGDGVPDHLDKQPLVFAKNVDVNGVAVDADGDGVIDELDENPNTPAGVLVDSRGNEIEMGGGLCCDCENVTLPTIIFDNGSSKIAPSSYGILYAIAEKMKQCPEMSVSATGYTMSKSGEQLAWKRSNAIIDHLEANYGIERSRIATEYTTGSGVEYSTRRIELSSTK
jgi:outer membrane protein OmpA-like peptidoglycan-associated protein